eukprot:TRINITY_DN54717_c0_g1_i1.p1 TRINITY_DN54717_c0_g1~~TRINITY_DN54717_c0_g1_i1.p1  ORF type:complete len:545 (-),score=99.59 TRINITY_DN54717_c0_g1_i1:90-1724(-)
MGKNQHSKDLLHVRPTEWREDGRGYKNRKRSPWAKLPLDCCFLSLQPFDKPVGTRDGAIFCATFIVAYIKRFGKNPVTGGKLEVSDLIPMHFHRNGDGEIHCPVTHKVFTNSSHVAANAVSGHVYSFEAMQELNRKVKNFTDLITSQPFKWQTDVIILQDPNDTRLREVDHFYFMQQGQQDEVIEHITHRESEETRESRKEKVRMNPSIASIMNEKQRIADDKAKEIADKDDVAALTDTVETDTDPRERKVNERYTSGEVAQSFTSSIKPLRTQNDLRYLTEEEELQEIYDAVRKTKTKGYVRLVTSQGALNVELHTDIVPRTTDNFLRLCEKDYYDGTVFHRLIRDFMMQGGDPTGTGKGGSSGFKGGTSFRDEFDSRLSHQGGGIVSMANNGKDTNRSQFFVTLKSCQHLDLKHSVFGRVVGGLELLKAFNGWGTDEKDRPLKEIKLIRTEIFKNPFKEAIAEAAKPKVEKPVDPVATWFSNRKDPMEEHKNRHSTEVGKYLEAAPSNRKREQDQMPEAEVEYANVAQKTKKIRTTFDFSKF